MIGIHTIKLNVLYQVLKWVKPADLFDPLTNKASGCDLFVTHMLQFHIKSNAKMKWKIIHEKVPKISLLLAEFYYHYMYSHL